MTGAILTVAGLIVFLPLGGSTAAAIVSTAAYTVVFTLALFIYQRVSGAPWGAFLPRYPRLTRQIAVEAVIGRRSG